jgi:murein DD-endopeptidase MepM/ murein hydrolase activator NlpD
VRAMGNGTVTYAQLYSRKVWGKLIVIDHGIVEGRPLFSRYAHVENICVTAGQSVQAGEMIANVGTGEGLFPYHLHFDISVTEQLRTLPNDWPNEDKQRLIQHYVDPKAWLQAHVLRDQIDQQVPPATPPSPLPMAKEWFVVARFGCRVRQDHSTAATQVGSILLGEKVTIEEQTVNQEDYTWGRIRGGMFNGDWMAMGTVDQTDMFVSSTPPS